jgi:hypothetical protein
MGLGKGEELDGRDVMNDLIRNDIRLALSWGLEGDLYLLRVVYIFTRMEGSSRRTVIIVP